MTTRMLIDARHLEETRVAVAKGTRIEEFDFEAAAKKQLKGNIYLAKVTRVEPSLQAAFVDYGGNRHGFLAFSEIHPDYYQIPAEDRHALLQEEHAHHHDEDLHADEDDADDADDADFDAEDAQDSRQSTPSRTLEDADLDEEDQTHEQREALGDTSDAQGDTLGDIQDISEIGAHDDADVEAARRRRMLLRRRYKIQEVIKRRQILLVQVVKEERGGKGAALTTYLSLAGRYSVLMPNTTHGGGISRKISNVKDRKRLKDMMADLKLPSGMGCIIRTAGLKRTKVEIRRDFDYLTRLWDEIRDTTLKSVAPALVYEDSNLLKRAIRDIYNRDIDEILVDGAQGYRQAKDFMRLLMPSHAKKVHFYRERTPLFARYQVEDALESLYHPTVQLRSGGYIVINPTEALVAIDINSGKATREHNIEETALKTNLEAADEIARQLRLRDMAGLVVIDFIDMEETRNVRAVERRLKDALKNDRARIQIGRISNFGLMEMSRQRLRTGVLEASTHVCPTCRGSGFVRAVPSTALFVLRGIEEEASKLRAAELIVRVPTEVCIYILNKKRDEIYNIEGRYGIRVEIIPKPDLIVPDYEIERLGTAPLLPVRLEPLPNVVTPEDEADALIPDDDDFAEEPFIDEDDDSADSAFAEEEASSAAKLETAKPGSAPAARSAVLDSQAGKAEEEDNANRRRRRRRRRRRNGREGDEHDFTSATPGGSLDNSDDSPDLAEDADADEAVAGDAEVERAAQEQEEREQKRRRRRGRRGGRRRREDRLEDRAEDRAEDRTEDHDAGAALLHPSLTVDEADHAQAASIPMLDGSAVELGSARAMQAQRPSVETTQADHGVAENLGENDAARPKRRTRRKAATPDTPTASASAEVPTPPTQAALDAAADTPKPKRTRRKKAESTTQEAAVDAAIQEQTVPPAEAQAAERTPAPSVEPAEPQTLAPAPDAQTAASPALPPEGTILGAPEEKDKPIKRGWWQRTFGGN